MSDLQPYGTTSGAVSPSLRGVSPYSSTGRALAKLRNNHVLSKAVVQSEAELQQDKVAAVTSVGRTAQTEVAMLTQMEQQLSQAVPMASSRLEAIGQVTTVGVIETVADTASRVRRL